MKKLLSVILSMAIVMSMGAMSTLSAGAQSAEDIIKAQCEGFAENLNDATDITVLNSVKDEFASVGDEGDDEPFYLSSELPYEEITYDGCTVYGYIGDADGDGEISVLDASAIQLHLVGKMTLSENGYLLSDTDSDDDVSVLDAAEIQLFLVGKSDNEYITHTVFAFVEETERTLAFDQIAEEIMLFGLYDEENDFYYLDFYGYYGEDVLGIVAVYLPEYKVIQIETALYSPETELLLDSVIDIFRGMSVFLYNSYMCDANMETFYFDALGEAQLTDEEPDVFDIKCDSFESEYFSDFSEVEELCNISFSSAIDGLDALMYQYTESITVRNLFR